MKTIIILLSLFFFPIMNAIEPTLHICTVASHQTQGLDQLMESCRYRNVTIDVLGFNKSFPGLGVKFIYVQEYIRSLPDYDVVLFVDGYDVLILENSEIILQKFLESGHNFIVSGERYCWPLLNRAEEFPSQPTTFRYVNSGLYIGYVDSLKSAFKSMFPIVPKHDDQGLLSAYYLKNPDKVHIDAYCDFFLTLAGVMDRELIFNHKEKKVILKETNRKPFAVHGNGGSRPLYQLIYDRLFLR